MNHATQPSMNFGERLRWFMRRVACAVYDTLIVIALFIFATAILMPFSGGAIQPPPYNILFDLYLAFIGFGYFVLVWRRDGQTLGMRAWRLRVIASDGQRISVKAAIIRALTGFAGWLCLGLGWLWILIDQHGRAWQDIIGDSRLLQVDKEV